MERLRLALRACVVAMLVALPAHADDLADAEDLFRRAKALMDTNKWEDACPLLKESYRLDPGMGTLLNLALCHEHIGRVASAWGEFRTVEQQARAAVPPKTERAKLAREHADKLEPRLSRIRIKVPNEARANGLVVKIDGEEKREPTWVGVPVDTGTRSIDVSAPNKLPKSLKVKVDDEGVTVDVVVPVLEDAPRPTPVASTPSPVVTGPNLEELEQYASNRARRTTGFVVAGIGLATALTGGVFGVLALTANNDAKNACPQPCTWGTPAAGKANDATDRALVFANVADVTIPLGVIGAAIGTYLVLSAGPTEKAPVGNVRVVPRPFGAALSAELW